MDLKLIYITWPNKKIATKAAKILVEEKLVACINILGPMDSFYLWQNQLNQTQEIFMLAKTKATLEEQAIKKIKTLHPYDIPCIISFNISNGNLDFLNWINTI